MNKFNRIENDMIMESELVKELRIDIEHLRNRKTVFKIIRKAWRRLVAPVNIWLFRRYVKSALRAGKMRNMIENELGWQPVMKPSIDESKRVLIGPSTEMITASPHYPRKKDGKYPVTLTEV